VDAVEDPLRVMAEAAERENTVCISALTGYGIPAFLENVEAMIKVRPRSSAVAPLDRPHCMLIGKTSVLSYPVRL
jgi:hypothetical protein